MKLFKKSLLALTILSLSSNLLPHGGGNGGGIALGTTAGLMGGMMIGSAMANNNRSYEDPSAKRAERELRINRKKQQKIEKDLASNTISSDERKRYEANLKRLQNQEETLLNLL